MNLLLFLGAGFSAEAMLPTQQGFLKKVHSLKDRGDIRQNEYNGISSAYNLAQSHEGKIDVTMEEAFSVLDYTYKMKNYDYKIAYYEDLRNMNSFINAESGISISEARTYFLSILERIYGYNEFQKYINQNIYNDFFKKLYNHYEYAIITTNYDLICEKSLENIKGGKALLFPEFYIDYKIGGTYIPAPLLKLHGSIDWKETAADLPNIVPPTFSKEFLVHNRFFPQGEKYRNIWNKAEKAIQISDIIIFIGYSFPELDSHLRFLFKTGLQPHFKYPKKRKIFVVKRHKKNINNFNFIKSSRWVHKFKHIQMGFKSFVYSDIPTIIEQ